MPATISATFAEILAKGESYQLVARLEVLDPTTGAVILDSATSTILNVVAGSIVVDWNDSFARSISDLQVVDPTYSLTADNPENPIWYWPTHGLVPTSNTEALSPASNNELRVSVGAMINGSPEYIPQGVFHLEGAKVEDGPEGVTITLSAYDRARKYSRAGVVVPRRFKASGDATWPGGWPIHEAIRSLLRDAYATFDMTISGNPTALLPEQDVLTGDDPWQVAQEWAQSMGYMLFFDRYGACQLQPVPNPNDPNMAVNWTYAEGGGGLLNVSRNQSNDAVYNGCAVTGVNPSNGSPVRSDMIWDDDEESATYYLGPFGKAPRFIQSDKVRDVPQANEMARAEVNKNKGLVEGVEFNIVPNPAIDPGDTVKLTRVRSGFPATGTGSEAVIVDRYSVNLTATAGAMTVGSRQRRVMS